MDSNMDSTLSLSSLTISYPKEANSESKKKKYKAELLRKHPETLRADFTLLHGKILKSDLVFYTEHPDFWHTTLLAEQKELKMCGNKTIRQLYLETTPKFNINFYKTGTVMIQGPAYKLEEFEKDFQRLKSLVEKTKPTQVPTPTSSAVLSTPPPHSTSNPPLAACSTTASASITNSSSRITGTSTSTSSPAAPRSPVTMKRIQDCLSLLEMELIEMKENKVDEEDLLQQLKAEFIQHRTETNVKITQITESLKLLQTENSVLKTEILRFKEELEQKDKRIDTLTELLNVGAKYHMHPDSNPTNDQDEPELHLSSDTLKENKPKLCHSSATQKKNEPELCPSSATLKEDEIELRPSSTTKEENEPEPRPSTATQKPSASTSPPKTAILIDSNGKFLRHRQMFPTHSVGKFWCPTTQAAHRLLHHAQLGDPENIIIHTGTNELHSHGKSLSLRVIQMVKKAHKEFPNANITISTLLPRRDIPCEVIEDINDSISRECTKITGITIAHHPTLTPEHLYDHVHVIKNNIWMLEHDLGGAVQPPRLTTPRPRNVNQPKRGRPHRATPSTAGHRRTTPSNTSTRSLDPTATPGRAQLPTAASTRPQRRNTAPSSSQHRSTAPARSLPHSTSQTPPPTYHQPSYAQVVSGIKQPDHPALGEVRQLLQLVCRIIG